MVLAAGISTVDGYVNVFTKLHKFLDYLNSLKVVSVSVYH